MAEQLQVPAVSDVAQPHADPEMGWGRVLLSFPLWVLNQRQIHPAGHGNVGEAGAPSSLSGSHLSLLPALESSDAHPKLHAHLAQAGWGQGGEA